MGGAWFKEVTLPVSLWVYKFMVFIGLASLSSLAVASSVQRFSCAEFVGYPLLGSGV
jgi:hypothetical protein